MTQQDILDQIDKEISNINPKSGKDIIFGLKIAKDIIMKDIINDFCEVKKI